MSYKLFPAEFPQRDDIPGGHNKKQKTKKPGWPRNTASDMVVFLPCFYLWTNQNICPLWKKNGGNPVGYASTGRGKVHFLAGM